MAHNPKPLRKNKKYLKLLFKGIFKEKIDYIYIDSDQFGFEQFHNIVDQYLINLICPSGVLDGKKSKTT